MLEKKIIRYIYVISILLSAGTIIFFPKWLVDDAYITFRYAENLANHFQLTFNINSQPVEGYTGIILPILIAFAIKIGISPIIVTHSIGIICFFSSGIFLVLLLKKIKISDIVCSIIVLIYSFIPAVFTHIFSGLETILFLSMINAVIYFSIVLISNTPNKTSSLILFGLLLLLLSLTRPEGVLFSSLIVLFCGLYFYIEKTNLASKYFVITIAVFIIPFSIYFIWRWNYYGQFFPNTYYLKTGNFALEYKSFNSFIEFF
ncbi:MAG: hypothetical protein M5U17_08035 [Ignavibacterium sp.]|nr:hypothetical protein [Ignavibacterium sp.]